MKSRSYQMKARAASAEATRLRILEAGIELLRARVRYEIRLDDIAAQAGVSAQTVVNLFGGKNQVLVLALAQVVERASRLRRSPQTGDLAGAVQGLYAHYESIGDWVVRNVFEEADPELLELGRRKHREW